MNGLRLRPRLLSLTLLLLPGLSACVYRSPQNAPGLVDIKAPLRCPKCQQPERPGDPGETYTVLSAGLVGGGGGRLRPDGRPDYGVGELGFEATLLFGQSARSLPRNPFFEQVMRPQRGLGATLGWMFLQQAGELALGPLYAEVQGHVFAGGIAGLGLGWAYDPQKALHGPQATLFWNVVYFRVTHLFGDERAGTQLTGGILLKWRWTWLRSR